MPAATPIWVAFYIVSMNHAGFSRRLFGLFLSAELRLSH
jgi:hypothetical protein